MSGQTTEARDDQEEIGRSHARRTEVCRHTARRAGYGGSADVSDTLKHVGYVTQVVRTEADFARALATARPRIAIVNTAARGLDFRQAIARAREAGVPVVAFGAHVDTQTQAAAREAGAARVVSNAKLAEDLPGILDRTLRNAAAPDHDEEGGSSA